MTHCFWITLTLLLLLLAGTGQADTLQPPTPSNPYEATKVQGDLINLRLDPVYDMPGFTLHCLIAALKAYPHARRFRVSLSLLVFNNGMNTAILYDRRRHSVIIFSSGGGDVLGSYRDHVRFTGVREADFAKIAKARRNEYNEDAWGFLGDLPKYGCRRRDLGSRHTDTQGNTDPTP